MPRLIAPDARLHAAWLECHREWGPGKHEDGFGLRPADDVDSSEGFAAWVRRSLERADPDSAATAGRPPCTFRWIVEGTEVLGGIALRHRLDARSQFLGHVGYGVRPSARGRGIASWALAGILDEARGLGLDRVCVVCAVDNAPSSRTIERAGGILEGIHQTEHGDVRRHWISL